MKRPYGKIEPVTTTTEKARNKDETHYFSARGGTGGPAVRNPLRTRHSALFGRRRNGTGAVCAIDCHTGHQIVTDDTTHPHSASARNRALAEKEQISSYCSLNVDSVAARGRQLGCFLIVRTLTSTKGNEMF